ncbi:hypothetical protein B0H14DRAFT_2990675 [Mycena olivaceomarginata]|nr:hypothetical protein B0H14DRAFT_2990675 [Mycena olivaceomarginata]
MTIADSQCLPSAKPAILLSLIVREDSPKAKNAPEAKNSPKAKQPLAEIGLVLQCVLLSITVCIIGFKEIAIFLGLMIAAMLAACLVICVDCVLPRRWSNAFPVFAIVVYNIPSLFDFGISGLICRLEQAFPESTIPFVFVGQTSAALIEGTKTTALQEYDPDLLKIWLIGSILANLIFLARKLFCMAWWPGMAINIREISGGRGGQGGSGGQTGGDGGTGQGPNLDLRSFSSLVSLFFNCKSGEAERIATVGGGGLE